MAVGTKDRLLDTTHELFGRYGYTGTGLKQVVTEANAPFGSLYHHFPGGKEQLGVESLRRSGQMYLELFEAIVDPAPDFVTGIGDFFEGAALVLEESDYADACPIATVALEVANTSEPLRQATADVFESWIAGASERLVAAGVTKAEARRLALTVLMELEGAFLFCRALRTTEPMKIAGANSVAAVRAALG